MGLFDTILGRSKPVQSNLDDLFALPSASITLQSAAGMSCSGHGGVCFKPPTGQGIVEMQDEVVKLLSMNEGAGLTKTEDSYGYQWLVVDDPDIEALVTQVHVVNSSLADAGWGPQLLCSVFGLAALPGSAGLAATDPNSVASIEAGSGISDGTDASGDETDDRTVGPGKLLDSTAYLVYLFKRGTFYPFVPNGKEQRDTEGELRLRSLVADDLKIESDLDRWFPLWDLPVH
jgi:hypothetical protein